MADTTLSNQIYSSRDQIKLQIIEYLKTYLELENIDLSKSSFLSFIVEILSTLTSNLLFYESSVFSEFFLTRAKLPESILNLSAFLGYNTREAKIATVDVLVGIPLTFTDSSVSFTIPEGHKFYADTIKFTTYYNTKVTVTNNDSISVVVSDNGLIRNIPTSIDSTASIAYFALPLKQVKNTDYDFQISEDLQTYQFSFIDVDTESKVSNLTVKVKPPDSATYTKYTEFDSLFLMTSTDYGYVNRRIPSGRRIYFGNGLIGFQPLPGSNVIISIQETEGSAGNVIAGSITKGDRIYASDDGVMKLVDYTVTNSIAASGGRDEEDIEDIRKNAIANLTSLGRFVSEDDYKHIESIISDSPLQDSYPVLKRSDVRSEIDMFTTLRFDNSTVPTRNTFINVDSDTTAISRLSTVWISGTQYYTLLDMTVDSKYNDVVYYEYILQDFDTTPTLIQSYGIDYEILASILTINRVEDSVIFKLSYTSDEIDYDQCTCVMQIQSNDKSFTMVNDKVNKQFVYTFSSYKKFPAKIQNVSFTLYNPNGESVVRYLSNITVRRKLDDYMLSPLTSDSTSLTLYDIPVILKSYYDNIDQKSFEVNVLQSMMSSIDFLKYRMLTDFINLKFSNTTGKLTSMNYNSITKINIIDMDLQKIPDNVSSGDRYIVSGSEGGSWKNQKNKIAQAIDSTSWVFIEPSYNDIVYVNNKKQKYIFTGLKWVQPTFDIPLQVKLDIYKTDSYPYSNIELINNVKSQLVSNFQSRFGTNTKLFRSEIIKTVQSIDGVDHCVLVTPESDIFFEFNLNDFTQEELLKYSPDYIYFDEDSIVVTVI